MTTLSNQLLENGYICRARSQEIYDIDAGFAAGIHCRHCGSGSMRYEPRYREKDKSYRAFAVCVNVDCDGEREF